MYIGHFCIVHQTSLKISPQRRGEEKSKEQGPTSSVEADFLHDGKLFDVHDAVDEEENEGVDCRNGFCDSNNCKSNDFEITKRNSSGNSKEDSSF